MSEPIVQTLTLAGAPLPLLNVCDLRANLRAARAEVRTTRRPLIIAERGTRPSAVLLDYATWCALAAPPGTGTDVTPAPAPPRAHPSPRSPLALALPAGRRGLGLLRRRANRPH